MRTDIQYDVNPVANGHSVQIGAGNMKTFRNQLKRAASQFPQLDPTVAEQHAQIVEVLEGDLLNARINFGPEAVFGGVATAIWLFLIIKTGRAFLDWEGLKNYISVSQSGRNLRHFVDGLPGLVGPDVRYGHKLVVRSVPATGELIAYAEILGVLKVGALYAQGPAHVDLIEHIYVFDLARQEDRSQEFSIEGSVFDAQAWRSVGLAPNDTASLRKRFIDAMDVLVDLYRQRAVVDS